MNAFTVFMLMTFSFGTVLYNSGFFTKVGKKIEVVNSFEKKSYNFAKENRKLKGEIGELQYKMKTLEAKNNYLTLKLTKQGGSRGIASVKPQSQMKNDMVKFSTYKWTANQLASVGTKEFNDKNYKKSAQYFHTLVKQYPKDKLISDEIFFQAGVSAYESNEHLGWAIEHLDAVVKNYPTSQYYRGAKLWRGLAYLKKGDTKKFYETVEEFRKKYRNTKEWTIISRYYEDLRHKYKN